MNKFNKIIADGKEFESFATPSELQDVENSLKENLGEMSDFLDGRISEAKEQVIINGNNNRDVINEHTDTKVNEGVGTIQEGIEVSKTDIINSIENLSTKQDEDFTAVKNAEAVQMLKLNNIDSNVNVVKGDVERVRVDVADVKEDVSNVNINVSSVKTDVADVKTDVGIVKTDVANVNTNVSEVKSDVADINGKLDDVLVGKDALKQAISEKIGGEASNTLVGMAEDVESLQHLDPRWELIGYSEAPRVLNEDIEYAKLVMNLWLAGASHTQFIHQNDNALCVMPNIPFSEYGTTTLSLKGCQALRYVGDIDLSSLTSMFECFHSCSNLYSLPSLDLPRATNMQGFCYNCTKLTKIGNLNTPNATTFDSVFSNCPQLVSVSSLDFTSATNLSNAFRSANILVNIKIVNLGNMMNTIDLSQLTMWGVGTAEDKESLRKTLVELTPTKTVATTVKLSANTFAVYETFSEEGKQIIEDKGYTLTK